MDFRTFLDNLRGRSPEEEDKQKKAAEKFAAGPGAGAPSTDEEPISELGSETRQEENERVVRGVARAEVPFGISGASSKVAGKAAQLAEQGPPKNLGKLAEEVRTQGFAHVYDDSGKLVRTIGQESDEGKRLLQLGRENKAREMSAPEHGLVYNTNRISKFGKKK